MFCPECGHRIEDPEYTFLSGMRNKNRMALSYRKKAPNTPHPQNMGMHGLIFTNLHLLAGKLEVDEQNLDHHF